MSTYRIAVIVGSLRRESLNQKLAAAIEKLAPPELSFKHVAIGDLPLYNQDNDGTPPDSVKKLKSEIEAADGIVFVTPEYNRSIPGVLKNAIDHASRPYGQNSFAGKASSVIGISLGPSGTLVGQQHLRNILAYLDAPTLAQPEFFLQVNDGTFDAAGNIGANYKKLVETWLASYGAWVKLHAKK
jgi:chromate reductase, NAD(P)H dehydrogenase (quinone)